ncbi:MAG: hypothetical protein M3Y48_19715 [Actinomycetota bacterium]|nr:hypothetical protein [Actinomycetota bacterium]
MIYPLDDHGASWRTIEELKTRPRVFPVVGERSAAPLRCRERVQVRPPRFGDQRAEPAESP